jgi:hypothetical protein
MRTDGPHLHDDVEISCLLPCGEVADAFDRDLSRCAPSKDWLSKFPNGGLLQLPVPPDANIASSVILVVWGKTRLLLCGDCELPSWNSWQTTGAKLTGEFHGLKIGHHGSTNGVFPRLLECLSKESYSVVTPFRRGKNSLPDVRAIRAYQMKCGFLRITASTGASALDGWDEDAPAALHALVTALDEPEGAAPQLLKLHAKTRQHENVVGLLFNNEGKSIDQYWGRSTERAIA